MEVLAEVQWRRESWAKNAEEGRRRRGGELCGNRDVGVGRPVSREGRGDARGKPPQAGEAGSSWAGGGECDGTRVRAGDDADDDEVELVEERPPPRGPAPASVRADPDRAHTGHSSDEGFDGGCGCGVWTGSLNVLGESGERIYNVIHVSPHTPQWTPWRLHRHLPC